MKNRGSNLKKYVDDIIEGISRTKGSLKDIRFTENKDMDGIAYAVFSIPFLHHSLQGFVHGNYENAVLQSIIGASALAYYSIKARKK